MQKYRHLNRTLHMQNYVVHCSNLRTDIPVSKTPEKPSNGHRLGHIIDKHSNKWLRRVAWVRQGVVTPMGTVVTAKTGVKKWSTGQGVFLPLVKQSRTIFTSPHSVVTITVFI